jgi:asparagine synthetase B (glutamine-hydrolysing)
MCGLFGMIGNGIAAADLQMVKDLGYVSALRGTDGAGVVQGSIWSSGRMEWITDKENESFTDFMWFMEHGKDGTKEILNDKDVNFILGHTRFATIGAATIENTHPFRLKTLIGMHNGTLKDFKYKHKTKTDSELMFHDIEARGIEEVLATLDEESAYALMYIDLVKVEIVIARNRKRPLFFTLNTDRPVMYIASEKWMLEIMAMRLGLHISSLYSFVEDTILRFKPGAVVAKKPPNWNYIDVKPKKETLPIEEAVSQFRMSFGSPEDKKKEPPLERFQCVEIPETMVRKRTKAEFMKECKGCGQMMDLFDQWIGGKMSGLCLLCDGMRKNLDKHTVQQETKH